MSRLRESQKPPIIVDAIRKGRWDAAISDFRKSIEQALDEWQENGPWQAADTLLQQQNYKLAEELDDVRRQLTNAHAHLRELRAQLVTLAQEPA